MSNCFRMDLKRSIFCKKILRGRARCVDSIDYFNMG